MNRHARRAAKAQAAATRLNRTIAVHEAGHAVARIITAGDFGIEPSNAIDHIEVFGTSRQYSVSLDGKAELSHQAITYGLMFSTEIQEFIKKKFPGGSPAFASASGRDIIDFLAKAREAGLDVEKWLRAKLLVIAFGPVAEAKLSGVPADEIWRSYEAESDWKEAVQAGVIAGLSTEEIEAAMEDAIARATAIVEQAQVWRAVSAVADILPGVGRVSGRKIAAIAVRSLAPI